MRKTIFLTSAAVVAALALAGCTASDDDAADEADTAPTQEQQSDATAADGEPADDEEPAEDDAPPADGDVAAPGTEVAVGETATVPWPDADEGEQNVNITVTDVAKAPKSDFDVIDDEDFQDSLKGYDVYYFTVEMNKAEPLNVSLEGKSPTQELRAYAEGDARMNPVNIIGSFDACDSNYLRAEEDESNDTMTTCFIAAAAEGTAPAYVVWNPYDTEYEESPVRWTA